MLWNMRETMAILHTHEHRHTHTHIDVLWIRKIFAHITILYKHMYIISFVRPFCHRYMNSVLICKNKNSRSFFIYRHKQIKEEKNSHIVGGPLTNTHDSAHFFLLEHKKKWLKLNVVSDLIDFYLSVYVYLCIFSVI